MKNTIIGWLAARGITLANDASDQVVVTSLQDAFSKAASGHTALANDKSALDRKVTALENELAPLKTRLSTAETALANEKTLSSGLRTKAATLAVDLVIQRGKLTVADRGAKLAALENSADFDAEFQKLEGAAAVVKTAADAVSGKQQAVLSNEAQEARAAYQEAFKTELVKAGQDPIRAHNQVMKLPQFAVLAAKLEPKKF